MGKNQETTTKFKVDISELKQAMQEAKRSISVANSEFKAVSANMDNWAKSSDGLKAKLKQLDSNLSSQKSILESLEKQYELVCKEQGENSAGADRLRVAINNQKATIAGTEKSIQQYGKALETAEKAEKIAEKTGRDAVEVFDELEDSTKKAGKSAEESAKGYTVMKNVLANLVSEGISKAKDAIVSFTKSAVEVGSGFESSMSLVASTMGTTVDQIDDLSDCAKEMGATTQFSASQAAEALNYLALAGYDSSKAMETLPVILNLAAAGGMELSTASDMVTDAMSALGMETSEATNFVDKMAKTSQKSNTNVQQLGEAILTVGGTAKKLAGGTTELNTCLGILADNGIKSAEGGTALRNVILSLTAPTDKARDVMEGLGISAFDSEGNMRPLNETLKDLDKAMSAMGTDEKSAVMSKIFNKNDLKAVEALLANCGGRFDELSGMIDKASGSAEDMAKTMNDNLSGDLKTAQSALEDLYITAYEELQPTLRDMVQFSTSNIIPTLKNEVLPTIKDIISWIVDNKDSVVGGLVAIGAGLLAFNVVSMIQGLVTAFQTFKIAQEGATVAQWLLNTAMKANPIGIVIGLITALVAGFIYLWNTSDEFREFWINLWDIVKGAVETAWNAIKQFFTETIPQIIDSIIQFFAELPENIAYWLGYGLVKIMLWSAEMHDTVRKKIPEVIDAIISFFKQLPEKIALWLANTILKIVQWKENMKAKGREAAQGLVDALINGVKNLPNRFHEIGSNIVTGIWNGIKGGWDWLTSSVKNLAGSLLQGAKDALGIHSPSKEFAKIGKFVDQGFAIGIKDNASDVLKSMKDLTGNVLVSAKSSVEGVNGGTIGTNGNVVYNFNQTNNSPKALSRLEIYRQSKNLLGYAGGA